MHDQKTVAAGEDESPSRRQLISTLAVGAAAAAVAAPSPSQGAQAGTIQRIPDPPGLQRPQANGKDTYAHVVVTTRRRTIYIAGQLARDAQGNVVGKGDMRAQVRQVCENIKAALAAVGATFADVVQMQTFVTSWAEYRKASDVRLEYFGAAVPASTALQVSELASPDFMVEINVIAALD
ncbi:MAG: RidA family protein [Proteobacteria bacterium]|nr:RidA family protein [Pseudomonadota bacterium]